MSNTFCVIVERGGRMYPCDHRGHASSEEAQQCAKDNNGVSIMEWVKERRPQFQEVWRAKEHCDG